MINTLPEQAKRYALVIGVNNYEDPQVGDLSGANRDARDRASDARYTHDIDLLEESAVSVAGLKMYIKKIGVGQVILLLDVCRNIASLGSVLRRPLFTFRIEKVVGMGSIGSITTKGD